MSSGCPLRGSRKAVFVKAFRTAWRPAPTLVSALRHGHHVERQRVEARADLVQALLDGQLARRHVRQVAHQAQVLVHVQRDERVQGPLVAV